MNAPTSTVNQLIEAINHGDLDAAVALYEEAGVLVVQPGKIARGSEELRRALDGFIAMKANLRSEAQQVIEYGDLALYLSRWNLSGTDPSGKAVTMGGQSTDILRRQRDGRWLIAVDNPWGAQTLPRVDG